MQPRTEFLFFLNSDHTARLGHNGIQWILEIGNPKRAKSGNDTGYRGVSYVRSRKDILLRCIRDKGIVVDIAGRRLLAALDDDYMTFLSDLERSGKALKVKRLETVAHKSPPIPERLVVSRKERRRRIRQKCEIRVSYHLSTTKLITAKAA